jgi:hypothetical protein
MALFKRLLARLRGNDGGFTGGVMNYPGCISCDGIARTLKPGDQMTCSVCRCTTKRLRVDGFSALKPGEVAA